MWQSTHLSHRTPTDPVLWAVMRVKNPPTPPGCKPLCACRPTPSGNPGRARGTGEPLGDHTARSSLPASELLSVGPGGRMQGVLGRHVDLTVVDVTQHGLEGLPAGHHLPDGDVHLAVLRHEGPEHGLKVAADRGGGVLALGKCSGAGTCPAPPPPPTHLERAARMALWAGLGCPSSSRVMSQNSAPAPSRYAFMSWIRDVPGGEARGQCGGTLSRCPRPSADPEPSDSGLRAPQTLLAHPPMLLP